MGTKILLISSALCMALFGLGATFLPQEVLAHVGAAPEPPLVLILQAMGALYLGFAMLNWMSKGSLLGGIYGRPLVVGNLLHFAVMAIALIRYVLTVSAPPVLIAVALVYLAFAVSFGTLLFSHPTPAHQSTGRPSTGHPSSSDPSSAHRSSENDHG